MLPPKNLGPETSLQQLPVIRYNAKNIITEHATKIICIPQNQAIMTIKLRHTLRKRSSLVRGQEFHKLLVSIW